MARLTGSISRIWNWVNRSSGQDSNFRADNYNLRHQCLGFIPVLATTIPVETRCNKTLGPIDARIKVTPLLQSEYSTTLRRSYLMTLVVAVKTLHSAFRQLRNLVAGIPHGA